MFVQLRETMLLESQLMDLPRGLLIKFRFQVEIFKDQFQNSVLQSSTNTFHPQTCKQF
jgi:hypothetical protein